MVDPKEGKRTRAYSKSSSLHDQISHFVADFFEREMSLFIEGVTMASFCEAIITHSVPAN